MKRRLWRNFFIALTLMIFGSGAGCLSTHRYICNRTSLIKVDGLLNESSWLKAEAIELKVYDGTQPQHQTQVKVLWDDNNIYIAFKGNDPNLYGKMRKRDDALFRDGDLVEVFFDVNLDEKSYYEFEINLLNTLFDAYYQVKEQDWRAAAKWNAKGVFTAVQFCGTLNKPKDNDKSWTVELAIPFTNFPDACHIPPQKGDKWRINFYRYNKVSSEKTEHSAWAPVLGLRFDQLDRFGEIYFMK